MCEGGDESAPRRGPEMYVVCVPLTVTHCPHLSLVEWLRDVYVGSRSKEEPRACTTPQERNLPRAESRRRPFAPCLRSAALTHLAPRFHVFGYSVHGLLDTATEKLRADVFRTRPSKRAGRLTNGRGGGVTGGQHGWPHAGKGDPPSFASSRS